MINRFRKITDSLITKEGSVLLAVSGGVDSMVMLRLFMCCNYNFTVAHCNFSLRGEESDGDTLLVKNFCEENNIKLHYIQFDTHAEMEKNGESVQIAARRLRYEWFEMLASSEGYDFIAIAHNSGDTIETFFINLLRGTGVRGLAGIPVKRDNIIRPLMNFTREEIISFAIENNVPWREDSSNSQTKYLRNKLRHKILPLLKEIEPDFETIMRDNLFKISSSVEFTDTMIEEIRRKSFCTYRGRITVSFSVIDNYKPLHFILFELLSPFGFSASAISDMVRLYRENASGSFVGKNCSSTLSHGLLVIISDEEAKQRGDIFFQIEDFSPINGFCFETLNIDEVQSFKEPKNIAFFDAEKITLPLTVRSWQEGDVFVPFGMCGRKKISDLFVDNKVHLADKSLIKILVDGSGDILWVVGMRSDNRYRVDKKTSKILKINYN